MAYAGTSASYIVKACRWPQQAPPPRAPTQRLICHSHTAGSRHTPHRHLTHRHRRTHHKQQWQPRTTLPRKAEITRPPVASAATTRPRHISRHCRPPPPLTQPTHLHSKRINDPSSTHDPRTDAPARGTALTPPPPAPPALTRANGALATAHDTTARAPPKKHTFGRMQETSRQGSGFS